MLNSKGSWVEQLLFYKSLKERAKRTDLGKAFTWGVVEDLLIPTHLPERKLTVVSSLATAVQICYQGNYITFDT